MLRKFFIILILSLLHTGCAMVATSSAEVTGLALLHDRRSSSTLFSDEGIEMEADIGMNSQKDLRTFTHINVTSYNGKVLLTGEAKTTQLRDKAVNLVRVISGVKIVHNEIKIAPLTSLNSRTHDAYITTLVKSEISEIDHIPGFDATRIKVITENNVVFLMGLVYLKEGNAATAKAKTVETVKKVIHVFEYID